MLSPIVYASHNQLQQRDVKYLLAKYEPHWKKQKNACTVDIGCGDGYTTTNLLLPFFGGHIIGIDFQEMTDFATSNNMNTNVSFHPMDIKLDYVPNEFLDKFDCATSFFCLMLVEPHTQVYLNLNRMLKPNSPFFFSFVSCCGLMKLCDVLAKLPKWKPYLHDISSVTKLQYTGDLEKKYPNFLYNYGFETTLSCIEEREYCFSLSYFKGFIEAVNPFLKRIPEELKQEYLEMVFNLAIDKPEFNCRAEKNDDGEIITITMLYDLLVIIGHKSEKRSRKIL